MIRAYLSRIAGRMEQHNPSTASESLLRERVSRLQGISTAFKDRKSYVKAYMKRCETRKTKYDRLTLM